VANQQAIQDLTISSVYTATAILQIAILIALPIGLLWWARSRRAKRKALYINGIEMHRKKEHAHDPQIGDALLRRLLSTDYIHRRSDKLFFAASSHMRHTVSIDTNVCDDLCDYHYDFDFSRKWRIVPLTFMRKRSFAGDQQVLRQLDVRDESDCAVPVLGHYDNALAAWNVLVHASRSLGNFPDLDLANISDDQRTPPGPAPPTGPVTLIPDDQTGLTELELDFLWRISAGPKDEALPLAEKFRDEELSDSDYPTLASISRNAPLSFLMLLLAEQYVLMVHLPPRKGPVKCERRIIKFSYDRSIRNAWRRRNGNSSIASGDGADERRIQRLFRALGRAGAFPSALQIVVGSILPCRSYHLEVHAPERTTLLSTRLTWSNRAKGGSRNQEDNHLHEHHTIGHVHAPKVLTGTTIWARFQPLFTPGPDVYVGAGFAFALWVAVTTLALWPELVARLGEGALSLLLLGFGFAAAVAATRPTHVIPATQARASRVAASLSLLAVFLAATKLVIAPVSPVGADGASPNGAGGASPDGAVGSEWVSLLPLYGSSFLAFLAVLLFFLTLTATPLLRAQSRQRYEGEAVPSGST
jgi:hypothetical protein